jgi:Domain of unknown function (DUF4872)
VIERRGTGGGNFRLMYSRFLKEAGHEEGTELAAQAAADWRVLARAFREASERDVPAPNAWSRIGELTREVLSSEEALWSCLAKGD